VLALPPLRNEIITTVGKTLYIKILLGVQWFRIFEAEMGVPKFESKTR
jgi:hypothetical protein